jgi:hypothetical protein
MKKLYFTLFLLPVCWLGFGQTILNSHSINLKNSRDNHQILNAVNSQNQVFLFATDKQNTTILKYNNYLFFTDSIKTERPNKDFDFMSGYAFDKKGNPILYWASEDFKKVLYVWYDFESNSNKTNEFNFYFKNEIILKTFTQKDNFYILSLLEDQNKLKFYIFSEGIFSEKLIDLSGYKFITEKGKQQSLDQLLRVNKLTQIDTKFLNPLFESVGNSKLYLEQNNLFLTFDSFLQTQLLKINLDDFSISEQIFQHENSEKSTVKSNSFLYKNILYQLKTTKEELAISATNIKTEEILNKYNASIKDSISFRNSPFISQTGNQKVKFLKNSKKFLQRLNSSQIGLSVYETPSAIMVTVGGVRNVNSTGDIILGITASIALVATGNGDDLGMFLGDSNLQTTLFEGFFNDNFQHQNTTQNQLAADLISQFLNENKVSLANAFSFDNYFILSYYDSKNKEIVLRKFEDFIN